MIESFRRQMSIFFYFFKRSKLIVICCLILSFLSQAASMLSAFCVVHAVSTSLDVGDEKNFLLPESFFQEVSSEQQLILAAVLLFISSLVGLFSEWSLRKCSVSTELYLKNIIKSNKMGVLLEKSVFIDDFYINKSFRGKFLKSRTLVRVFRAQVSILPNLLSIIIYALFLLYISPPVFFIIVLSLPLYAFVNSYMTRRVRKLEGDYLSFVSEEKKLSRNFFSNDYKLDLSDVNLYDQLVKNCVHHYYTRSYMSKFSSFVNFSSFLLFFFCVFFSLAIFYSEYLLSIDLENVLLVLVIARGVVLGLSQVAASYSVIQKYFFHAEDCLKYIKEFDFNILESDGDLDMRPNSRYIKVLSPVVLNSFGVSFYLAWLKKLAPSLLEKVRTVNFDALHNRIELKYYKENKFFYFYIEVVNSYENITSGRVFLYDRCMNLSCITDSDMYRKEANLSRRRVKKQLSNSNEYEVLDSFE